MVKEIKIPANDVFKIIDECNVALSELERGDDINLRRLEKAVMEICRLVSIHNTL